MTKVAAEVEKGGVWWDDRHMEQNPKIIATVCDALQRAVAYQRARRATKRLQSTS